MINLGNPGGCLHEVATATSNVGLPLRTNIQIIIRSVAVPSHLPLYREVKTLAK